MIGKIFEFFYYGGLSEKYRVNISTEIDEANRRSVIVYSAISMVAFIAMTLISLSEKSAVSKNWSFYVAGTIIMAVMLALNLHVAKNDRRITRMSAYLFVITLLAIGILLAVSSKDDVTASYMVFLFVAPLLFTLRPGSISLIIIGSDLLYMICMYRIQIPELFQKNIVNAVVYGSLSIFVSATMIRTRIEKFEADYENRILMETDQLTGILNRHSFVQYIEHFQETGSVTGMKACMFDVNGLKNVNDHIGHHAGDEMIRGAAACLENVFSRYGYCYRIGGDEFVAILPDRSPSEEELIDMLNKQLRSFKGIFVSNLSVSCGIVVGTEEDNITTLLRKADNRMYENKASFYRKEKDVSPEELKTLELIKALTSDYYDVFSVNINDGGMILYRLNGKALSQDSVYRGTISYADGLENYIQKYVHPDDQEMLREACALSDIGIYLRQIESRTLHYRVILRGELHYYYRKIVRIGAPDSFEDIVVGIGCEDEVINNREKRIALQKALRKVELNAATGLLTKEAFFIYGDKLLKEQADSSFDCYFLKIDNLEAIRHQYGPIARKQVLQDIASVLKLYQRDIYCTAYLGDGVYACFAESQDSDTALEIRKKFEEIVQEKSNIKNIIFKWTVYRNISTEQSTEETYNKITYVFNTLRNNMNQDYIELDQEILERLDWGITVEQNFDKSLKNGEFHVWYQPKYSVHTKEIVGAEALARWIRQNGEMIPPYKFVPILENSGLINRLDEEIFRQVCIFQKKLKDQNIPQIPISVNLSRASIFTQDIPEVYAEIARSHGISTSMIPIEITESAAVRASMIDDFAKSLIKQGFSIHMDDFGAGYSSLASLQMLPFECIKIDKSLVDFIGMQSGESLLKHTIAFAKETGLHVIAEGVEKLEQFMFLKYAGCDAIQGYYFSKPLDEEAFEKLIMIPYDSNMVDN